MIMDITNKDIDSVAWNLPTYTTDQLLYTVMLLEWL